MRQHSRQAARQPGSRAARQPGSQAAGLRSLSNTPKGNGIGCLAFGRLARPRVWSCSRAQSCAIAQWLNGAAAPTPRTQWYRGKGVLEPKPKFLEACRAEKTGVPICTGVLRTRPYSVALRGFLLTLIGPLGQSGATPNLPILY